MQERPMSQTGVPSLVGLLVFLSLAAGQPAWAQATADAQGRVPPGMVLWETAAAERAPESPELLARGEALYGIRCAVCHGKRGDGEGPATRFMASKPRDFRRGVFKFRTAKPDGLPSDRDLFRSITAGFPAYGMPPYRYLSQRDRWSLVYHVKALVAAGGEEQFPRGSSEHAAEEFDEEVDPAELQEFVDSWMRPGTPVSVPAEPKGGDLGAVARGRKLFQGDVYACVRCHGPNGKGDGPSAKELKDDWGNPIRPRNYTLGLAYRKVALRRQDVVRLILLGIPGTPMPSNSRPTESPRGTREAWDVAAYVEHLTAEARQNSK